MFFDNLQIGLSPGFGQFERLALFARLVTAGIASLLFGLSILVFAAAPFAVENVAVTSSFETSVATAFLQEGLAGCDRVAIFSARIE